MDVAALKSLAKGLLTYVPGLHRLFRGCTGGTTSARYCYSVWLRHLVLLHRHAGAAVPHTIAELGPGDSIGIGLAGLLCGAERYYALDVVRYADPERNLAVLEDLIELLQARAPVPGPDEFPRVHPMLESYEFPSHRTMNLWLKPGGFLSHQVDFACHGTSDRWDGHRRYSERLWRLIQGARPFLLNREPCSAHLDFLGKEDFEVFHVLRTTRPPEVARSDLAPRFAGLSDEDRQPDGVYLVARKPPAGRGAAV